MTNKMITTGLLLLSSYSAVAQQGLVQGQVEVTLTPNHNAISTEPVVVNLPRYHYSDEVLTQLKQRMAQYRQHGLSQANSTFNLPRLVNLGMNGTPVLDQGRHGSCVTFAVTGALNATLGAGDYISQLCNLELGEQLVLQSKAQYSGWDGNYASNVYKQIDNYGIVPLASQKMLGCAGVKAYPLKDSKDTGSPMPVKEFKSMSVKIAKLYDWKVLMFNEGWLLPNTKMDKVIWQIKQNLSRGNLVTFGVLLDVEQGHGGALGSHHSAYDTWMLTPQIIKDGSDGIISAGHDMVITGYDDDAIVTDDDGNSNQGIFYLRNSWSDSVGDNGNYYVSYDYFKLLTQEAHAIKRK